MPTNREGDYVRSASLPIYTPESERRRLSDPRLSEAERRQTKIHAHALQRRERDIGRKLQQQREEEARRLQQRRAEAADNRAATWSPTWDSPTHPHPAEQAPEPWQDDQDPAYLDPITTHDEQEGGTDNGDDAIRR